MNAFALGLLLVIVLATPVHATVIHTIVNETFGFGPGVSVDLNGDGAPDVDLQIPGGASHGEVGEGFVAQSAVLGGGVSLATGGELIGPSTPFSSMVETADVACFSAGGHLTCPGVPFSTTFFVGAKFFDADSNVHFGWMRIDVEAHQPPDCCPFDILTATLVDDAWETVAGAPIRTPGTAVPEPAATFTLGAAILYAVSRARRATGRASSRA